MLFVLSGIDGERGSWCCHRWSVHKKRYSVWYRWWIAVLRPLAGGRRSWRGRWSPIPGAAADAGLLFRKISSPGQITMIFTGGVLFSMTGSILSTAGGLRDRSYLLNHGRGGLNRVADAAEDMEIWSFVKIIHMRTIIYISLLLVHLLMAAISRGQGRLRTCCPDGSKKNAAFAAFFFIIWSRQWIFCNLYPPLIKN